MSLSFKVVIPARYGSTRLVGKPLLALAGKAMVLHVCDRARESGATDIVVATDNVNILEAVKAYGFNVLMTRNEHQSGTERIAEVAQFYQWAEEDIIVNLQGDEPLLSPEYIRLAAETLAQEKLAGIATLAAEINAVEDVFNTHAVKVVLDKQNYALYFSRAAIPWHREDFSYPNPEKINPNTFLRHIGLYAYRVSFLQRYINWDESELEQIEKLEQLRILWQGEKIVVACVAVAPEAGVDTEDDLSRVALKLARL